MLAPPSVCKYWGAAEKVLHGVSAGPLQEAAVASPVAGPRLAGVMRWVDRAGRISLIGITYKVGRVRVHPIRHDRTEEHGAYAKPNGRPRKAPKRARTSQSIATSTEC